MTAWDNGRALFARNVLLLYIMMECHRVSQQSELPLAPQAIFSPKGSFRKSIFPPNPPKKTFFQVTWGLVKCWVRPTHGLVSRWRAIPHTIGRVWGTCQDACNAWSQRTRHAGHGIGPLGPTHPDFWDV